MRTLIFLLLSITAAAQTTDVTFSIDSTGASSWHFTTTNTTTLSSGDQSVQGYRRFFDNKDSVLSYANRVLAAVRVDSVRAKESLVLADSAKYRVGRAIFQWHPLFTGPKSAAKPPSVQSQQTKATQTKATKPRTKRVKNLKSKQ